MSPSILYILFLYACSEKIAVPTGDFIRFSMPEDGSIPYISIDEIKEAFDNNEPFLFLDARPTVDYNLRHIQGAYSVPFYEVEYHESKFPSDTWYIAYCACPHAESGIVAEYFLEAGHETIGILDEGYLLWEERDYPTEIGPDETYISP